LNFNFNKKRLTVAKIEKYILQKFKEGKINFIPSKATHLRIKDLSILSRKRSFHHNCTFSVKFSCEKKKREVKFFLKFYDNVKASLKEYKIMRLLKEHNFPVPNILILERDERILGAPFIIFEKIEGENLLKYFRKASKREAFSIVENFAKVLVSLHNIDWKELKLDFLKPPENEHAYALRQVTWQKKLPEYVDKKGFKWVTGWLEKNVQECQCNRYALLHFDMNLRNFLVTKSKKIVFVDWEWGEIGDPLADVTHAYHCIRQAFGVRHIYGKGAEIALYFLKSYIKRSNRKIKFSVLKFYLVSTALREAVFLRHIIKMMKHSSYIKETFGNFYVILAPAIRYYYRIRYKYLLNFLRRQILDYEELMFGTYGTRVLSRIELNDIVKFLKISSPQLILDVGTGTGRIAREIMLRTQAKVVGVDANRLMIKTAKAKSANFSRYELVIADGHHLPFRENSFDAVICIRVLKYFPNYMQGISEIAKVLKLHGELIADFSSMLGYETLLRYIKRPIDAQKFHTFNFYKIKGYLSEKKLFIADSHP